MTELEKKFLEMEHKGVGFIKSRKSDDKIMAKAKKMYDFAEANSLEIVDIIVDRSSGLDVDRKQIDLLISELEKEQIDAVAFMDLIDVTRDEDDMISFAERLGECGVSVYLVTSGKILIHEPTVLGK